MNYLLILVRIKSRLTEDDLEQQIRRLESDINTALAALHIATKGRS